MTARQGPFALVITTTMDTIPVINIFHPDLALMLRTLQRKEVADAALLTSLGSGFWDFGLVHNFDDLAPCPGLAGQKLCVAKEVEATFRSGQRNTCTIVVGKKSNRVVMVRSDE